MICFNKKQLKHYCEWHKEIGPSLKSKTIKEILRNYKNEHCCERCGAKENLTFHHTKPELKKYEICELRRRFNKFPLHLFIKELNQCELLCDKCHKEVEKNKLSNIIK